MKLLDAMKLLLAVTILTIGTACRPASTSTGSTPETDGGPSAGNDDAGRGSTAVAGKSTIQEDASTIMDASAITPALCDGTVELKLRVYVASDNQREYRGSIVRVENGLPSFAVDGQCNYWLSGGWSEDPNSRNLGWKQGKLDTALAALIERTYPLVRLSELQDCGSDVGAFDTARQVIVSKAGAAMCRVAGPRFRAAWAVIADRAADLWSSATPMTGGIWISASESPDDLPAYDWPLAEPLSTFVVPESVPETEYQGFSSGVAHLVTDPDAVKKLRALRERYLMDAKVRSGEFFNAPKVTDGKQAVRLYMRDAIPYEDGRGLLPFMVGA